MATIDYKQKIKDYMNSSEVDTLYKSMLNNLFPELAESDDEKIRKGIIRNLEYLMDRAEGFVKDELKERIAWLEKKGKQKSINDLTQQEAMDIAVAKDENDMGNLWYAERWLNSLKDRYTWKPSNEQMKFLWKYAEQNNYDGAILTSLYKDLKKLREE